MDALTIQREEKWRGRWQKASKAMSVIFLWILALTVILLANLLTDSPSPDWFPVLLGWLITLTNVTAVMAIWLRDNDKWYWLLPLTIIVVSIMWMAQNIGEAVFFYPKEWMIPGMTLVGIFSGLVKEYTIEHFP